MNIKRRGTKTHYTLDHDFASPCFSCAFCYIGNLILRWGCLSSVVSSFTIIIICIGSIALISYRHVVGFYNISCFGWLDRRNLDTEQSHIMMSVSTLHEDTTRGAASPRGEGHLRCRTRDTLFRRVQKVKAANAELIDCLLELTRELSKERIL